MALAVERAIHHLDAELTQVGWALGVELGCGDWLRRGGIAEGNSSMWHSDAR
jgi:hypothetical protein